MRSSRAAEMPDDVRRTQIEIPWRTLLRIVAVVALVWLWLQLVQTILLVIVAIIFAVTLDPVVSWLQRRRLPRWGAALIVSLTLLALIGGFLWLTWSSLSDQAAYATEHLAQLEKRIEHKLPEWMRASIGASGGQMSSWAAGAAVRIAQSFTSAIVVGLLGFILTIYLLIEGEQTLAWLLAFVPREQRGKADRTVVACRRAIVAYMAGNIATSICAFVFALVALSTLKVPAALLLAVTAGLFDFVPVVGLIVSSVPPILLAATVSGKTALLVALLYVAYHTTENYLIAPYVYGDRLKLSNVVVVLAFA